MRAEINETFLGSTDKYTARIRVLAVLIGLSVFLCGCSRIIYDEPEYQPGPRYEKEKNQYTENRSLFYPMNERAFSEKHQMEDLTSYEYYDEFEGFEGRGYIKLEEGYRADFELNIPSAQHYSISLCIRADSAASTALTCGGAVQGAFSMNKSDGFTEARLDGIYLEAGVNRLSLTQLKSAVYIDFITVNDIKLPDTRFDVSRSPANPNASNSVRLLMDYFGEVYGKNVILSQHVTPGTNTEINAVYEATGRFPAIRFSDLMRYSRSFTGDKPAVNDVDLAVEWARGGGIVGFDWTWFSPPIKGGRSHYYAGESDINLNEAFTTARIAELDDYEIEELMTKGEVSETCLEIIRDLDYMAENLKILNAEKIPVLWRPVHQASTRWFWWGNCDPESYKWLWRLMFERFSVYHGLNNLIWVWAAQDYEYYPGDGYVDIIGADIYNMDDASNIPEFFKAGTYSDKRKMAALTECGLIPSPDLLSRDRALWLWTSLYRGDYLVDYKGRLSSLFNLKSRLERAYNHELTIALDELPENF